MTREEINKYSANASIICVMLMTRGINIEEGSKAIALALATIIGTAPETYKDKVDALNKFYTEALEFVKNDANKPNVTNWI